MATPSLRTLQPQVFALAAVVVGVIVVLGSVAIGNDGNAAEPRADRHTAHGMQHRVDKKLDKRLGKPGKLRLEGRGTPAGPGPRAGGPGAGIGPFGGLLGPGMGKGLGKLPKALKDDLKALRKAAPADREALLTKDFAKALAGDYGKDIQTKAEKLKGIVTAK